MTVTAADCQPLTADPAKRVGCWIERAKKLMPELTDELVEKEFAVTTDSNLVTVTVAWPTKKGQCLSNEDGAEDDEFCTYTLQSRL